MNPVLKIMLLAAATVASIASAYMGPVLRTISAAVATMASLTSAEAQTNTPDEPLSTVHFGTEIWTATDHGSGEAANYDYIIGDGSNVRLLGIYGNAALDNAKPDANDREFIFSITSANNTGSAQIAGRVYNPSHHSADSAIFAGVLKQTGSNDINIPINVTFPDGGVVLARGAVRIAAVTGVYDPTNGFHPISYPPTSAALSSELHLTFVYRRK